MSAPAAPMPLLLTQVISRNRRETTGGASLDAPMRLGGCVIRHPLVASVSGQTFAVVDEDVAHGAAGGTPTVGDAGQRAAKLFTSRYTEYVGAGVPSLAALADAAQPPVGALPRLHITQRLGDNLLLVFDAPAGQPLDQWLASAGGDTLPLERAAAMVADLARGIASLHGFGFVHGDLRPSGIFVSPETPAIALADWGHTIPTHLSMTDSGAVVGHAFDGVAYASPDVLAGSPPRREDDAWALACIAYEMLAGRHPFDRRGATEVLALGLKPAPIERLGDRCNALLASALAPRRTERTVSLSEMASAFGALAALGAPGARRGGVAAAARSSARTGGAPQAATASGPAPAGASTAPRGRASPVRRVLRGVGVRMTGRRALACGAVAAGMIAVVLAWAGIGNREASLGALASAPAPATTSATSSTTGRVTPPSEGGIPAAPTGLPSDRGAGAASVSASMPGGAETPRDAPPAPGVLPAAARPAPVAPPSSGDVSATERSAPVVEQGSTASGPVISNGAVEKGASPASREARAAPGADAPPPAGGGSVRTAAAPARHDAAARARAARNHAGRANQAGAFQRVASCPACDCASLQEKRMFTLEPLRAEEQSFLRRSCRG